MATRKTFRTGVLASMLARSAGDVQYCGQEAINILSPITGYIGMAVQALAFFRVLSRTEKMDRPRSPVCPIPDSMAEITTLREAIAGLVRDGDVVAMEGFTHLIPFAAGHEVLRQQRRQLTLIRMTPDVIYDQMIGAGCASKLIFSWGGNPGVGSLHRLRDAVENGWPAPLEIEEHAHAGMAAAYAAGAANLPFGVLRGYFGTDLTKFTRVRAIECPFTGERLCAVPAIRPDVAII